MFMFDDGHSILLRYTKDIPFYINVVREPVSQYVSVYYFFRFDSIYRQDLFTKEEQDMVGCATQNLKKEIETHWSN